MGRVGEPAPAVPWQRGDYCFPAEGPDRHCLGRVTGVRPDRLRVRFGRADVRELKPSDLRRAG